MSGPDAEDDDWVEKLTRLAGSLGFNPVRVRWKLTRLRQSWAKSGRVAEQKVQHIQYEHKVCPNCGRLNDRYATRCVGCGKPMSSRTWQMFERVGVTMPSLLSISSLLGLAMMGVYAYMMVKNPGQGYGSWSGTVLVERGANWRPATFDGQWWRLGTYMFLHIGLWHLGFNLLALAQIGPAVERAFGRWKMLFFFVLTGVVAGLGSAVLRRWGYSAGASGALMGLIGVGAGWGHRDGSTAGRAVRNMMLKWALYTMGFGFLIHADNAAHGMGFVLGALLGYLTPPAWVRGKSSVSPISVVLGLVSAVAALGSIYLILMPPRGNPKWVEATTPVGRTALGYAVIDRSCQLRQAGQADKARSKLAELDKLGLKFTGEQQADPVDAACRHAESLRAACALEPPTPEYLTQPRADEDDYDEAEGEDEGAEACAAIRMADGWKAKGY